MSIAGRPRRNMSSADVLTPEILREGLERMKPDDLVPPSYWICPHRPACEEIPDCFEKGGAHILSGNPNEVRLSEGGPGFARS